MDEVYTDYDVDLSDGGLANIPVDILVETSQNQNNISLNLGKNYLRNLPDEIDLFRNLTRLSLYSNDLYTFPIIILSLRHLKLLNLSRNHLSELPSEIRTLNHLETLRLAHNSFRVFPTAVITLPNLKLLDLSNNQLSGIPETIRNLTQLESLLVTNNSLYELPESLADLPNLKILRYDTWVFIGARLQNFINNGLAQRQVVALVTGAAYYLQDDTSAIRDYVPPEEEDPSDLETIDQYFYKCTNPKIIHYYNKDNMIRYCGVKPNCHTCLICYQVINNHLFVKINTDSIENVLEEATFDEGEADQIRIDTLYRIFESMKHKNDQFLKKQVEYYTKAIKPEQKPTKIKTIKNNIRKNVTFDDLVILLEESYHGNDKIILSERRTYIYEILNSLNKIDTPSLVAEANYWEQ